MAYQFYTADVFTEQRFGGNPLAVIPDARGLSTEQMQTITREFNLSETTFVFPPNDPANTFALRIFTPGSEIPFAGHPTVGTALVLLAIGKIALDGDATTIIFEEGVGPIRVDIRAEAGSAPTAVLTTARLPEVGPPPPDVATLAEILSIAPEDIRQDQFAPEAVSCGVPFLFVPLRDLDALKRARTNLTAWENSLANYWAPQMFLFTTDSGEAGVDIRARMYAPSMGIAEDPATGAAAAAFAGYLAARDERRDGTLNWLIAQGVEMGRRSHISIAADMAAGAVTAVRVGGSAVLISEGKLYVDA